jgi:uncharacterized protein involved in response to NO
MALITLEDPRKKTAPPGFALWALGFRPFYLLAALFAALAIPLWVVALSGGVALPLPAMWWHAHEMLFGFAAAVIVGFLYTAGQNWTGLSTPKGIALAALAGLWLAGRVALLSSAGAMAALVDWLFLPAAALGLGLVLVRAGSRRNYFVLVILGALSLANLMFHLARLDFLALDPLRPLYAGLGLIVVLETAIGGRVIPNFTANGLRMAGQASVQLIENDRLNRAAIAATLVAMMLWVINAGSWAAFFSCLAGMLQSVRSLGWKPWRTFRVPLVWILHLGHLWIPLGLFLLASAQLGWVPRSAPIHAFGIGATGGLIIGMMTRTALGHTGQMLIAGWVETLAYACIQSAAWARVLTLVAIPAAATGGIHVAATLWSTAFLAYFVRYLPLLIRARKDGRPG